MQAIQSQDSVKIRGLVDKIDDQEDKINALIGIVIRQDQQIQALNTKLDVGYAREFNKDNILINGIAETPGEDCYHEVANFMKNILKVDKPIPLTQAYRIGKTGARRPILAKLKTVGDKASIYAKIDNLKSVNRGRDKPYFVTDQIPEAWAEKKKTNNYYKQQNFKLPIAQQQKIEIKKGVLMVDDRPHTPSVKALSISQLCNLSTERKKILRDIELIEGSTEEKDESKFVGYAADVRSIDAVQKCYEALWLRIPDATHIICAFKLPGTEVTRTQGFLDDGEHGAGRTLLNILNKHKIVNKAIFVTRHYGGKHIGATRFQLIEKVALAALKEIVQLEKAAKQPLTADELEQLNEQIRQQAEQQELLQQQRNQHPWSQQCEDELPEEQSEDILL